MTEPPVITVRTTTGTKLAKVIGRRRRQDGVVVWEVRPRFGKRYSRNTIEVTAGDILGQPLDI